MPIPADAKRDLKMSELTLSRDEVRSLDAVAIQEVGVDGIILMENAARGVCDQILRGPTPTSIHIFCGPGNNGGDGFALARQLAANNLSSVEAKGGTCMRMYI